MCKRCGGSSVEDYCADCARIRQALASALPRYLSGLMGPPSKHPCHYCPSRARSWDHVVPRDRGGPDDRRNLVPACHPCNQAKANSRGSCRCEQCRTAWRLFGPAGTGDTTVIPGYSLPTSDQQIGAEMVEPTPVESYVVRDDVLYLITGGGEDLAFLLARNSPLAVSSLLHNNAPDDVHHTAARMLHRVHEREVEPFNTAMAKHLVVDHNQDAAEINTLRDVGLVIRHRNLHAGGEH